MFRTKVIINLPGSLVMNKLKLPYGDLEEPLFSMGMHLTVLPSGRLSQSLIRGLITEIL